MKAGARENRYALERDYPSAGYVSSSCIVCGNPATDVRNLNLPYYSAMLNIPVSLCTSHNCGVAIGLLHFKVDFVKNAMVLFHLEIDTSSHAPDDEIRRWIPAIKGKAIVEYDDKTIDPKRTCQRCGDPLKKSAHHNTKFCRPCKLIVKREQRKRALANFRDRQARYAGITKDYDRICPVCGMKLPADCNGNRKYHKACYKQLRRERDRIKRGSK
jgi:hypothetical protein